MAIAFDAASPDTSSNANVSSLTSGAFTIAGTNRLLIGAMAAGAGSVAAHNAMKQGGSGGTAMTQVGTSLNVGANGRLSVWRLVAPPTGSTSIYGEYAAAQDETMVGGVSYTGVDQSTPIGTPVTATGTLTGAGGNMTVNVTTAVGDTVFAAFYVLDGNGNAPLLTPNGTPAGTGRYEIEGAQLNFEALQMQEVVATGTTTTVSCACAPTSGSLGADWGVIAFVVAAASGGGGGPSISGTSTASPAQGSTLTITGTAFGASQGSGSVTLGGVTQTVTSWADTSIDITVDRGVTKYGVAANLVVIDNSLTSSSPFALTSVVPQSGWSYIDLTTPNPAVANRLSSYPDIASGDQIAWETVGGLVTVAADATFSAAASVTAFQFEVWTTGGWGTTATQELYGQSFRRLSPIVATDDIPAGFAMLDAANWLGVENNVRKWVADELAASGGTAAALASTVQAQTTVSADLSTTIRLAAAPAALTTLTAALTTQISLAAAPAGQVTLTAALTTQLALTAAAQSAVTVAASLTTAIPLAAASTAQTTASAALTTAIRMAATAQAVTTVSSALSTQIALAAAAQSVATLTAALSGGAALAASPAAQVTVTADLTTAIRMAAAPAATTSVTAALTTQITPAAAVGAQCTVTASLTTAIALQAAAQSVTTLSATLAGGGALMQADVASACTVTASLTTAIRMQAAVQGVTTMTAGLAGSAAQLAAAVIAQAQVSAALTTSIALQAIAQAQTTSTANLSTAIRMAAAAQAQSTVTANMETTARGGSRSGPSPNSAIRRPRQVNLSRTT